MLATMWAPLPPGVPSEALPPPAPSSVTVALEASAGTVMLPVPAAEQVIVVVAPETTGAPHTPSALAGAASAASPARARALVAASAVSRLGRRDVRGCNRVVEDIEDRPLRCPRRGGGTERAPGTGGDAAVHDAPPDDDALQGTHT